MSNLETLKREHPAIQAVLNRVQRDGNRSLPEERAVAALADALQQHEATIAERTTQRDECGRLAAEEAIKVSNLRFDLAAARSSIAERDATIKEKDARIAELEQNIDRIKTEVQHLVGNHSYRCPRHEELRDLILICDGAIGEIGDDNDALAAKLAAEQQAHAATKEELRKADEALIEMAINDDPSPESGRAYHASLARVEGRAALKLGGETDVYN